MSPEEQIRANIQARCALRRKIAAMVADARADLRTDEVSICFETAERILTTTEAEVTA